MVARSPATWPVKTLDARVVEHLVRGTRGLPPANLSKATLRHIQLRNEPCQPPPWTPAQTFPHMGLFTRIQSNTLSCAARVSNRVLPS